MNSSCAPPFCCLFLFFCVKCAGNLCATLNAAKSDDADFLSIYLIVCCLSECATSRDYLNASDLTHFFPLFVLVRLLRFCVCAVLAKLLRGHVFLLNFLFERRKKKELSCRTRVSDT